MAPRTKRTSRKSARPCACDLCKQRKTKCKLVRKEAPRSSSKEQQSQAPNVEEPAATERATECRAPSVEVVSSAAPANEQLLRATYVS
ncbi:hypothetical protein DM02DRAFT_678284 [Periconia macrospinosa]|uniref:Zn(2)-C6 fungal-type domain-containing protein n=1 Tax=Periconia macrospinosa TaxID=97972 RepID=A0A2V1CZ46_9PLEO|nr:hypothetical protein DM02DRAFT_678284 [Periconia macrospinosa]